jgi:hypothetical protein
MRPFKTEFGYQGRTLRQLGRTGRVAVYELLLRGKVPVGHEVIVFKIEPAEELFGKMVPEREAYPSSSKESSDWGKIAWSWGTAQKRTAWAQFEELVNEEQEYGFKPSGYPNEKAAAV